MTDSVPALRVKQALLSLSVFLPVICPQHQEKQQTQIVPGLDLKLCHPQSDCSLKAQVYSTQKHGQITVQILSRWLLSHNYCRHTCHVITTEQDHTRFRHLSSAEPREPPLGSLYSWECRKGWRSKGKDKMFENCKPMFQAVVLSRGHLVQSVAWPQISSCFSHTS